MKLPRWLVIAMLTTSVLSVLAAAGWWWVTWPERTARQLYTSMLNRDLDDVLQMIPVKAYVPDIDNMDEPRFVRLPYSCTEVCRGRRQFEITWEKQRMVVTVEKGAITELTTWRDIRDMLPRE